MSHKRIRGDDNELLRLFRIHLEEGWSISSFQCKIYGGNERFYQLVRDNKEFAELNSHYKNARLLYRDSMVSHASRRKNEEFL